MKALYTEMFNATFSLPFDEYVICAGTMFWVNAEAIAFDAWGKLATAKKRFTRGYAQD